MPKVSVWEGRPRNVANKPEKLEAADMASLLDVGYRHPDLPDPRRGNPHLASVAVDPEPCELLAVLINARGSFGPASKCDRTMVAFSTAMTRATSASS